jgi:hypothetical protein
MKKRRAKRIKGWDRLDFHDPAWEYKPEPLTLGMLADFIQKKCCGQYTKRRQQND